MIKYKLYILYPLMLWAKNKYCNHQIIVSHKIIMLKLTSLIQFCCHAGLNEDLGKSFVWDFNIIFSFQRL